LKDAQFKEKSPFIHVFHKIQTTLFHVGAELATPTGKEVKWKLRDEDITQLETQIDEWDSILPPLTNFILPGGHPAGAALHVARTVVRRAERSAVSLGDEVNPLVLSYLNRLSDFLFVAARFVNAQLGEVENTLQPNS
jgi:cob(I)alamin adenosyltransferase